MELMHTVEKVQSLSKEIIRRARIRLGVTRTRNGRRTTWKKQGSKWQPKQSRIKTYKSKINNTGVLRDSLEAKSSITSSLITIDFLMENYGEFIDQGRGPTKRKGTGIVERKINKWIQQKPIKPRDMKTGRFITRKAGSFLIARKIHHFGYEGTYFMTEPMEEMLPTFEAELEEAIDKDVTIEIDYHGNNT